MPEALNFLWSASALPEPLALQQNAVTVTTVKHPQHPGQDEPQGNQVAVAEPIVANGRHVWVITILESWRNWGDGMLIGVMDATVDFSDAKGVKAWGLLPMTGMVHTTNNASHAGQKGKQVCEPLDGASSGAVVKVQVDVDRKTLSFSVNGGEFVDAGVSLTAQVRPYVLMCFPGDKVSLESAEAP